MSILIILKGNESEKQKLANVLAKLDYRVIDFDSTVRTHLINNKYYKETIKKLRIALKFRFEHHMFNKEKIVLLATHISCEDLVEFENIAKFHKYQISKRRL